MPELTPENIQKISCEVRKQEITYSCLADELIDHICCDVEDEMKTGLTFMEAYRKVRQKIGPHRLKEIQEETIYAVDTKYRYMKNLMKISGAAGATLFGIAALFKIQHWPGAGLMMTLGTIMLVFMFLPSSLGVLWKETKNRRKIFLFISAFFAMGFFIFGTLFKVQHWPGAGTLLLFSAAFGLLLLIPLLLASELTDRERRHKRPAYITGAAGSFLFAAGLFLKIQHWTGASLCMITGMLMLGLLAMPMYVRAEWKDESHVSSRFIFLIIASVAVILPAALLNLNLQSAYEAGFFQQQEQEQVLFKYLEEHNTSVLSTYKDSTCFLLISQLHAKTDELLSYVGNIQIKMVQESKGKSGRPEKNEQPAIMTESGPEIQNALLTEAFRPALANEFLLESSATRQDLANKLTDYIGFISSLVPGEGIEKTISSHDLMSILNGTGPDEGPVPVITRLHSLELLKNSILIVESKVLGIITNG